MSRFQDVKDFLERRLLTAVSRDLGEERTTSGYEEELQRQRKLLQDGILIPEIKLHRAGVELLVVKEEELPPEQQERSHYPDQEENESPLIKEEEEEVWIAQGREQLQGLEEADTKFLFPSVHMKSENDEEKPQSSLLHQRLTEHMETAAGGEDCGRAEPARSSDPQRHLQAEIEVKIEASPDTGSGSEDEEDEEDDGQETRDCPKGLKSAVNKRAKTVKSKNSAEPGENSHLVSLREKRPFSCLACGKGLTRKADLERHMLVHTKEKPFSCSVCETRFGLKSNLMKHLRLHLKKIDQEKPQSSLLHQRLTEHMETAAGGEDCGRAEPARSSDPQRHLQAEIEVKIEASSDAGSGSEEKVDNLKEARDCPQGLRKKEQSFSCSECGKGFNYKSILCKHMFVHSKEKHFSCSECGKQFKYKANLSQHMVFHTNEQSFSCSECGKSFNFKSSLTKHMVLHSQVKPFSCSECGKEFKRKENLNAHISIHSKEKTFSCPECGRRFNNKPNLTKHMAVHSKEKPFSCAECGKRYKSKSNLNNHTLVHTKQKPYCSSEPGNRFYHKERLHMVTHSWDETSSAALNEADSLCV